MNATLDHERYAAVLASLVSDGRRNQERRRNPRVGIRMRLQLIVLPHTEPQPAGGDVWLRDISNRGLGLASRKPMRVKSIFIVALARPGEGPSIVAFRVTNSRRISDELHSIGAVALAAEELDEVKQLLIAARSTLYRQLILPEELVKPEAA